MKSLKFQLFPQQCPNPLSFQAGGSAKDCNLSVTNTFQWWSALTIMQNLQGGIHIGTATTLQSCYLKVTGNIWPITERIRHHNWRYINASARSTVITFSGEQLMTSDSTFLWDPFFLSVLESYLVLWLRFVKVGQEEVTIRLATYVHVSVYGSTHFSTAKKSLTLHVTKKTLNLSAWRSGVLLWGF